MALTVQIGDTLQLQALDGESRPKLGCLLIGAYPPLSLLVTLPQEGGRAVFVKEGSAYAVRMFDGGNARAFTTRVVRACLRPFQYLHLSYPQDFEEVVVRGARRVTADLPARAVNETLERATACEGRILDLSLSGAMLRAPAGLGQVGDALRLELALSLEGQAACTVALPATLRRPYPGGTPGEPGTERYGVEFGDLEPQPAVWLRAYIYEQLLVAAGQIAGTAASVRRRAGAP